MDENSLTFRAFCVGQVQRLSVYRRFDFVDEIGQREIRNWLERRGDDTPETREQIRRLVDAATELDAMPDLSDLGRLWNEQHPPRATASPECQYCWGAGWEIIERNGITGAKRCRCGGVPLADPNAVFTGVAAA